MSVHYIKRCGNCKKVIDRDNEKLKIGNPISNCCNCGAVLVDPYVKEIIMFGTLDYIKYFFKKIFLGLFAGFIASGVVLYIIDNTILFWTCFTCISVIIFVSDLKMFNKEKIDSIKRTKNYNYLNELYLTSCITKEQMEYFIDLYNVKVPKK